MLWMWISWRRCSLSWYVGCRWGSLQLSRMVPVWSLRAHFSSIAPGLLEFPSCGLPCLVNPCQHLRLVPELCSFQRMGRSQQLFPFLAIASQSPCETGAGKGEPAASRHSPCPAPPHPTPPPPFIINKPAAGSTSFLPPYIKAAVQPFNHLTPTPRMPP